ncbi:MAG: hypothetical protein HZA89_14445 [Verrucomicrobia bacterium]|nr:hypothetical protein [Verrucomicrobiota bacterium]
MLWLLAIGRGSFCSAAEAPPALRPDRVDAVVKLGATYLVRAQSPDGMIQEQDKRENHGVAMTALALMGLASVGHQPADKTTEGEAMRKAVAFLLRTDVQTANGYFGQKDGSRMYGHGIVTLALTELLGMGADKAQDAQLRERAQRGVNLILAAQRVKKHDPRFIGGWRYSPDAGDSDLSVTVWQLLALRSAKNAGLVVPKEAIDAAVGYLRRSYVSPRDALGRIRDFKSAFGYVPGQPPSYAMAAAGLLAMQVCGLQDEPEVLGAADWLRASPPVWETSWFFYGTYYYAQGMKKRGGDVAREARERVEGILLARQLPDGSWDGAGGADAGQGKVYCSALALLSLSVQHHYLPIYQD